jgi:hypothetical protein
VDFRRASAECFMDTLLRAEVPPVRGFFALGTGLR